MQSTYRLISKIDVGFRDVDFKFASLNINSFFLNFISLVNNK